MINTPTLPPKKGYVEVEIEGVRTYLGVDNSVKIATGSYTGTGTYGSRNPNTLTFDFEPKLWGVYAFVVGTDMMPIFNVWAWNATTKIRTFFTSSYTYSVNTVSYDGNTVSWYEETNSGSAERQLNNTYTYYYFAIG